MEIHLNEPRVAFAAVFPRLQPKAVAQEAQPAVDHAREHVAAELADRRLARALLETGAGQVGHRGGLALHEEDRGRAQQVSDEDGEVGNGPFRDCGKGPVVDGVRGRIPERLEKLPHEQDDHRLLVARQPGSALGLAPVEVFGQADGASVVRKLRAPEKLPDVLQKRREFRLLGLVAVREIKELLDG
ncbi:MAG TPA: hypothetical protein VGG06_03915 [Thermoanaerobaculia bacterium]